MKMCCSLLVIGAVLAQVSGTAQAARITTTLTFDGAICGGSICRNGDLIDGDYGSVPGHVAIWYTVGIGGTEAPPNLIFHDSGYGDLTNVARGDGASVPAFGIVSLDGRPITLNSFDLSASAIGGLVGETGVYDYSKDISAVGPGVGSGLVAISGTGHFHYSPNFTSRLRLFSWWDTTNYFEPNSQIGIDNITFTYGGIPEPAAWTMMIIGFLGAGSVLRRRRAEPVHS